MANVSSRVRAFYEEIAFPGYDGLETTADLARKAAAGIYARGLDDQLPIGVKILDAGCGTGQLAAFLSLLHRVVIGVDFSYNSLRRGQEFKQREGLRGAHFVQMDLLGSALRGETFDYVFCNGVLHHTADAFGGFRDLCRVLKPGGFIVIGLYNTYGRLLLDLRRVIFRLTRDRLTRLDYFLRRSSMGDGKKRTWFLDQYHNPHETKFSVAQVLRWFAECGIAYVNSLPQINLDVAERGTGGLFTAQPVGRPFGHLLSQLGWIFTQGREGGFFLLVGQKPITDDLVPEGAGRLHGERSEPLSREQTAGLIDGGRA